MPISREFPAVTVIALEDGEGGHFQQRTEAFPAATAEQWAAADRLDPGALRDGGWWLRFRCFAFRFGDGGLVLVDTGIGPAGAPARTWAPVPGRLPEELRAAGIAPDDVDTVVLTHMHTDHIGWSVHPEAGEPFFRNARYLMQRDEIAALEVGAPNLARWLLEPLRGTGQLDTVHGDLALRPGLRLVPTPGHTPGHQSVLLDTGDGPMLATGDLLVHAIQLAAPDVGYAHESDPDRAAGSRRRVFADLAATGATLATAHLSDPFVPLPRGGIPAWTEPPRVAT